MELLNEFIFILKRNRHDNINSFLPKGTKARKLYEILESGEVTSDEEAQRLLNVNNTGEENYNAVKRKLAKILSEQLFSSKLFEAEYVDYQKFLFYGRKELIVAEKLLNQNVYHNAEKIILKVRTFSERFYFLDLQLECAKLLRTVNALKGYLKEVEHYALVIKKLVRLIQNEQEARGFADILESKVKFSIGRYREIAVEASHYSFKINEWHKENANPYLKFYQYKADLVKCYHLKDMREWGQVLTSLEQLATNFPFIRNESLTLYIHLEWVKYFRSVGDIPQAVFYLNNALEKSTYETFNRFEVQALNFDIKIKEKKYTIAGAILNEVRNTRQFHLLDNLDKQSWLLREACLYFIFKCLADDQSIRTYTPEFEHAITTKELTNRCSYLSMDKKGYYLMVMIIKEVVAERKGSSDAAANDLLLYYQRYLKDACENRTKDFVKKFARDLKQEFESLKTKKDSVARLTDQEPREGFDAIELIPYGEFYSLLSLKVKSESLV